MSARSPADGLLSILVLGLLYDAVLLWAYGVNKTLEQGYPPDDGTIVTKNIINTTFQGITGKIKLNEVGDRFPDERFVIYKCLVQFLYYDFLRISD